MAMRDIGSHAPHLKVMGRPKALGSRRPGRAGEPAVGDSMGASESLDDVPQDPRLPSYPPVGPTHRLPDLYGSLSALLGIKCSYQSGDLCAFESWCGCLLRRAVSGACPPSEKVGPHIAPRAAPARMSRSGPSNDPIRSDNALALKPIRKSDVRNPPSGSMSEETKRCDATWPRPSFLDSI